MSVQSAKGLALLLRHYSREFRDARMIASGDWRHEMVMIANRMSYQITILIELLPTPIKARAQELAGEYNLWDLSAFFNIVGYLGSEVVEVDDDGRRHKVLQLPAGLIALQWPDLFESMFVCVVTDLSDDEIKACADVFFVENKFRIFGMYATACDLLADWIENHADDDQVDPIPPGDGLQCDDTMFVWGGKTYTSITPAMGPLLKVLMRAYRYGRDATLPEFEAAAGEIKDGFGRCFDVGKHPNRSKHPVWKSIKGGRGKYRLIDPVKAKTGSR